VRDIPGDRASLESADRVVFDTVTRGILLRMIWDVPDDAQVYVSRIEDMAGPNAGPANVWIDPMEPGNVYASYAGTKDLRKLRAQIEALFEAAGFTLLPSKGGVPGVPGTKVIVLGPKGPPSPQATPAPSASPSPGSSPSPGGSPSPAVSPSP
jgi:hypothetical protein